VTPPPGQVTRRVFLKGSIGLAGVSLLAGCAPASPPTSQAPAPQQATPAPTSGTITLGALFPYTGNLALLGNEQFNGCDVAVEMVNERGGIDGKKIELVKADAPDPTAATSEANRLITQAGQKLILGSYSSALSVPATAVAERARVIYWEVGAVSDQVTARGFKYAFRTCANATALGNVAAEYAARGVAPVLGTDPTSLKVVIIHEDGPYGTDVGNAAAEMSKSLGLQVLAKESYSSAKTTDFAPMIVRFKGLNPDILIATSYINDAVLFWKQARELEFNVKAHIGTGGGHGIVDFARARGDDVNGVFDVDPPPPVNPAGLKPEVQAEQKEFIERFTGKTGHEPFVHATMGFAGTMMLLKEVLPKAGGTDPEKVREAALNADAPEGSFVNGWGVRFAGPEAPNAGQNLHTFAAVTQWQEQALKIVFPEKYATHKPIMVPLPAWVERGA
jgi:branched-chain amino acid transport system substrate-binding protein